MAKEFLLPELAESVVEGEILKWMVKEGDDIKVDQPIVEVMTDKVTVELPSPFAGKLTKIIAPEGSVVAVKAPIAIIDDGSGASAPAAEVPKAETAPPPVAEGKPQGDAPIKDAAEPAQFGTVTATDSAVSSSYGMGSMAAKFERPAPASQPSGDAAVAKAGYGDMGAAGTVPAAAGVNKFGRVLAVPAARAMAREMDVDIAQVPGSGPLGRVGVDDVKAFATNGASAPAATPSSAPAPAAKAPTGSGMPVQPVQYKTPKGYESLEERVPLRGLRRAISNQMLASHLYTVRTLTVDEVDMSALVALRERMKPVASTAGVKLTYLPFIFKAVASALKAHPNINSSIDEAAQEIVKKNYFNIGCAVDTEAGLVVPVVKDVDRRSILEIAKEINALAGKAREGKLAPDDMAGSTFSVTNMGSAGSLISFPIINVPDAGILGVHTIQERAVVRDGQIVVRHMMYLSLSFDHRIFDGAEGARFVKHIGRLLESPDQMLLEAI
jgi:2-oxoisovalerate dehydrogenase E2 component (dihydrolipoyl transacylase)